MMLTHRVQQVQLSNPAAALFSSAPPCLSHLSPQVAVVEIHTIINDGAPVRKFSQWDDVFQLVIP
jgi:hypothetical protein